MGATPFLMERLPDAAAEMARHVLAHLTRVMNILGRPDLLAAVRAT